MAGFNIDPQISLGAKPPQVMSIGDMVNIARGAQAYKQAEEINPLAVKKAQQETESGAIDLAVKQQTNEERLALQEFFKNPDNYQTDGQFDLGKVNASVPKIAPLTGPKYVETMTGLNKAQTEANSATQEFGQKTRGIVAGSLGILGRMGIQDKNVYKNELTRLKESNPEDKALSRYVDAQTKFLNDLPNNADIAKGAIAHANELLTPESQQTKFAKTSGTIESGGNVYQTINTPSVTGENPTIETTQTPIVANPVGGNKTTMQTQDRSGVKPEDMNKPIYSKPEQLKYPVRQPGAPIVPVLGEEEDRKAGIVYRDNLVNTQSKQVTQKRNLDEVVSVANQLKNEAWAQGTGVLGNADRKVSQFFGTEKGQQYKQLNKDLANAAIANIKASGGSMDTVSGQQLTKMANGDETYPPKVLIDIARRTQADMANVNMQATAAQKFATKFGDSNMKSFQQMWSKNADSKIFEGLQIINSSASDQEKQAEYNKLFGHMTTKEKKVFQEKKNNINKLMNEGTL